LVLYQEIIDYAVAIVVDPVGGLNACRFDLRIGIVRVSVDKAKSIRVCVCTKYVRRWEALIYSGASLGTDRPVPNVDFTQNVLLGAFRQ
jgi:hypothetical protein